MAEIWAYILPKYSSSDIALYLYHSFNYFSSTFNINDEDDFMHNFQRYYCSELVYWFVKLNIFFSIGF